MKVILYTIHCPKCDVLEQKLNMKNISFTICEDVSVMQSKGIDAVPVLEVDGNLLQFPEAVRWVNAQADIDSNN